MKLLFLADASSYHTQRWVNYFAKKDHQCHLLSLEEGIVTEAKQYHIQPKLKMKGLKYFSSYSEIKRIANQIKPDLVNALFVPNYGLLGALLNFRPFALSAWGSDILVSASRSFFHKFRAKFVLGKADLILSDSNFLTEKIIELGVEQERISTSPLGIEIDKYLRPKQGKETITVLSTRRFEPIYDLETFIRAIPLILANSQKKVEFIIVGSGSQSEQLKRLAYNLKLQDKIMFKASLSDKELIQTYLTSDIYVSTSLSDSTSVSLLEAMASGLIPVVTDIPGNKEWIEDRKNGFLFPISDHRALAEQIIYVIDGYSNWVGFRERNISVIKKKAIWEDNMKVVEEEFLKLAG